MKTSSFFVLFIGVLFSLNQLSAQLKVDANGNVIIGTSAPGYKLQVDGSIFANNDWIRVSGQAGLYFQSYGGGFYMTDASWIRTYGNKSFSHQGPILYTSGIFRTGSGFVVDGSGNVGIGVASPSYKLHTEGTICVGAVTYASDSRLKENIKEVNSSLSLIKQFRPVTYTMKMPVKSASRLSLNMQPQTNSKIINPEDELSLNMQKTSQPDTLANVSQPAQNGETDEYYKRTHIGFLAQEIQKIYPELVYADKKGKLSIDYVSMIPILVAAIKEQQVELDKLKKELEIVKGKK